MTATMLSALPAIDATATKARTTGKDQTNTKLRREKAVGPTATDTGHRWERARRGIIASRLNAVGKMSPKIALTMIELRTCPAFPSAWMEPPVKGNEYRPYINPKTAPTIVFDVPTATAHARHRTE
ncbi:hypothetical protein [Microbacterium sp. K41]|uniref:hypothetical protein n=1 Tax=Microbacterium sp. K41 TaxID=2305437 RepID=UPI00109C8CCC|nr:hypothetical protein [Microbacterium sp. K41]MBN6189546.1 hypothetical protein [Aneurinibacillus sp. BA2021]